MKKIQTILMRRRRGSVAPVFPFQFTGGFRFDTANLAAMWQTSTGLTAVSASGQPVGLLLDQSQGLVRGPELLANGGFDGPLSEWGGGATLSIDAGRLKAVGSGFPAFSHSVLTVDVGKSYWVEMTLDAASTANMNWRLGNTIGATNMGSGQLTPGGTLKTLIVATHTTLGLWCQIASTPSATCYIDNVSVRELPGSHARQAVAGTLPTYTEGGGLAWLANDGNDTLSATVPDLGTNATIWYANENGATILTGQTVGAGAFPVIAGEKTTAIGAIDRDLTAPERAALIADLNGQLGVAGDTLFWPISDFEATNVAKGFAGSILQGTGPNSSITRITDTPRTPNKCAQFIAGPMSGSVVGKALLSYHPPVLIPEGRIIDVSFDLHLPGASPADWNGQKFLDLENNSGELTTSPGIRLTMYISGGDIGLKFGTDKLGIPGYLGPTLVHQPLAPDVWQRIRCRVTLGGPLDGKAEVWIDATKVVDQVGATIMTQAMWTTLGGGTITPGVNSMQFGATANSDAANAAYVLMDNISYTA